MFFSKCILLCCIVFCMFGCGPNLPEDVALAYRDLPDKLDYNQHVKPILSDKCFACHGPDKAKQKAGLRLDLSEAAFAALPENKGKVAIDPGNLKGSEFYHRIMSADPDYMMPSPNSHLTLSASEKAVLIKWIEDGAEYKPHWAFVKAEKPAVPKVSHNSWPVNSIDRFILARLESEKMKPSAEAEKELLLRRVSLDLTGLPPTISEIDAFLADKSINAYEKQVDRLLKSFHYGEKMAVDWLDLARFADSHGYTVDRLRDMSPYRDWVISAFNSNIAYDKFLHWQLAGDLMPNPTKDMLIATAFNRNHQQNMEGGVVEEEFQTEYVVDRTNTFGDAMLGLSVGCAKCHDHKYDPVSQKNYYELFSFFNNVKEAGQISWDDALPTPTLMLPTASQEKMLRYINANIAKGEQELRAVKKEDTKMFETWLDKGSYKKLAKETIPQQGLQAYLRLDGSLRNEVKKQEVGSMKRESGQAGEAPLFVSDAGRKVLKTNGDEYLDLNQTGVFRKSDPFSIGIGVNIPDELHEGVILHKSQAERLYNFRGYHLYLKNDRLELSMAHTAPSNAITKISEMKIPKNKWLQITITYDGSSKAAGYRLFMDGKELKMKTEMDQLSKDILFSSAAQPGLQVGGWWRGLGFKDGTVKDIAVYNRTLTLYEIEILAGVKTWVNIAAKEKSTLNETELDVLRAYYTDAISPVVKNKMEALHKARTMLADSAENIRELMVMQEMPVRKKAHILLRGNYDAPGQEVFPGTPSSIMPFPKNLPKNRYGLAQWLTHQDNPLTARVAVNRIWQNFFGIGLVKTTEDFGNQGEMPSHPELLDWLAVTFRESGWDVKKLNKLIVMSATYRQNSIAAKEILDLDPENRLLARGPMSRLSAEMIRDNVLMASGLINKKLGGQSVKPYQPEGLWEINNTSYQADSGQAVYRRSLYVIVKRSVPNPTLSTFGATSRSFCVVRRQKTNTPLQALVTLNDPTFTEAARALAMQMCENKNVGSAIQNTYRKLTGRRPTQKEVALLVRMQKSEYRKFTSSPAKTQGWISQGQLRLNSSHDKALVAAHAVVASTILNSDAALTKR